MADKEIKITRIATGSGTADSFIDLAGYAACGGEIAIKAVASPLSEQL